VRASGAASITARRFPNIDSMKTVRRAGADEAGDTYWLVHLNGPLAGDKIPLRGVSVSIGRGFDNDLRIAGDAARVVSTRHAVLTRGPDGWRVRDQQSTNGTFVDGERSGETTIRPGSRLSLGPDGPAFQLVLEHGAAEDDEGTVAVRAATAGAARPAASAPVEAAPAKASGVHDAAPTSAIVSEETMVRRAVEEARLSRDSGLVDQTGVIMRQMVERMMRRTRRRHRRTVVTLSVVIAVVAATAVVLAVRLRREKADLDARIAAIETRLQQEGSDPSQVDALIDQLAGYERQAQQVENAVLYRFGPAPAEADPVEREIRILLREFGAEEYSIPPEFTERVKAFIARYQGPDRLHMERALGEARPQLDAMRRHLQEENLPPDLAYMALVESAFLAGRSSAGAVGLWQFTPATARAYGLRVEGRVDERLDAGKATRAAARYIRELILDFGAGSSVMLALAAYNVGPGAVRRAVRTVNDPIKQRNFWYLYRARALPAETREYVPKLIAAVIIGRRPRAFGF
jgi:pSer/pThr/pTyr-binding forkhead associated (FHA) protein